MAITALQVKELRQSTGAGMMECKKALTETNGDLDAAIELMRKSGLAKAAKKAGRIAAEGMVVMSISDDKKKASIIELNCETDFVAREDAFKSFAQEIADLALAKKIVDVEDLSPLTMSNGQTVEETRAVLIAKIGENIQIRRVEYIESDAVIAAYSHGARIGVLISMSQGEENLARDLAMHVAATRPEVVRPEDVSQQTVDKEKEIFTAQAIESGKPQDIVEKMVAGRIKKFLNEVSLHGQAFVKDPSQTVLQLIQAKNAEIANFIRFEVGEGIEKKTVNFAEEVKAQAEGR